MIARRLALGVLAGAAAAGCAIALAATAAWLIVRAAGQPPVLSLAVAVVAVRAFGLGRGLLRYVERLLTHDAALRVLARLRVRVYVALERIALAGLPAFRRGDLLARLVGDVDDVQNLLLRALLPGAIAVLAGAGAVTAATVLRPSAGAVLAAGLVAGGVGVPYVTHLLAARAERRTVAERAALTVSVVDAVQGAADLIAFGAADDALQRVADAQAGLDRAARSSAYASGAAVGLGALVAGGTLLAVLRLGAPRAVLALLTIAAFEAVAGLPVAAAQLVRSRRALSRVRALDRVTPPVGEPSEAAPVPEPPYTVELAGVVARWSGRPQPALDGVDLVLTPGRRVAVVGASGAGKSTLAAVLLRFLDPSEGSYRINGVDARALASDDVRRVVGLCAQDAHLFDSSVAANLRLARPSASDDELLDACRAARLDDWLAQLPDGLDTPVGEHGSRVSGGERQRIALARALLADFPVLVLDEPTASLDAATADALTADLLAATRGRTTVLIAHRLAHLDQVDEILVLDAGRIVERGAAARLLAAGGRFAAAWQREHGPPPAPALRQPIRAELAARRP